MRIGFVGAGIMGLPMIMNLRKAGHDLVVYIRRIEVRNHVAALGIGLASSPAELAASCDVVLSCVGNGEDVADVALGPLGIARGARPGALFIDLSTIAPEDARSIASELLSLGIDMLEAPVSGGEAGAKAGSLTIFAAGSDTSFRRALPILRAIGSTVTHMGPAGCGQLAKACNQIVTGCAVSAVAEALTFATAQGADAARVRTVLLAGLASSRILDGHGARMLSGGFAPGFKAWMHHKDLGYVLQTAHACGIALPLSAAAWSLFSRAVGDGYGEEDSAAVIRLYDGARRTSREGGLAQSIESPQPDPFVPRGGDRIPRLGFIGLGAMGEPMVRNLMRAGYPVSIWSRRPAAGVHLVGEGARRAVSPAALARECEIVFLAVTGSADVEQLIEGKDGLLEGAKPGLLIVDHSTIAPQTAVRMAECLRSRSVGFLDAPVSGGALGAREGTLAIMVGGESPDCLRALPLLNVLGKTVVHIGPSGTGQVAKACNQLVMVCAIQALAEALLLAQSGGVNPVTLLGALREGSAASRVLDMFGERIAERRFSAGIEAYLHHKDFGVILDEAQRHGLWIPMASVVAQQLNALMGNGWGRDDTSSLFRVLEAQSGKSRA